MAAPSSASTAPSVHTWTAANTVEPSATSMHFAQTVVPSFQTTVTRVPWPVAYQSERDADARGDRARGQWAGRSVL